MKKIPFDSIYDFNPEPKEKKTHENEKQQYWQSPYKIIYFFENELIPLL